MSYRYALLVIGTLSAASLQAQDSPAPPTGYLGGTASAEITGQPNRKGDETSARNSFAAAPYYLTRDSAGGPSLVRRFTVVILSQRSTDAADVGVSLVPTFGRRHGLFQRERLFAGLEYGVGPRLGWDRRRRTQFGEEATRNVYELGVGAYATIVVGYGLTDRLRVVADLLNAGASAGFDIEGGEGLVGYGLSARLQQGFRIGVEWGLRRA